MFLMVGCASMLQTTEKTKEDGEFKAPDENVSGSAGGFICYCRKPTVVLKYYYFACCCCQHVYFSPLWLHLKN